MDLADDRSSRGLAIVVTSLASDAHTWNLVYLQLVLEELGHRVVNLGACVPDDLLVSECARHAPDLVVVSSVNGHGCHEARRVISRLRDRAELTGTRIVVGGKLGIDGGPGEGHRAATLTAAGYDAVFEGADRITAFRSYVDQLRLARSRS